MKQNQKLYHMVEHALLFINNLLHFSAGGIVISVILITSAAVLTLMMIKRQQSITTTAALNKRFPQTFQSSIEAQHLLESEDA